MLETIRSRCARLELLHLRRVGGYAESNQDKEKPMAVRNANIMAARGTYHRLDFLGHLY